VLRLAAQAPAAAVADAAGGQESLMDAAVERRPAVGTVPAAKLDTQQPPAAGQSGQ
jgi:hypothetical protein